MARKVSDGQSVRVTVPANTAVTEGALAMYDGFFGIAMQQIVAEVGIAKPLILNIEECEIETSQVLTSDTFAVGDLLYWDNTNKRLTKTATNNTLVGKVTVAEDANDVIWFKRLHVA